MKRFLFWLILGLAGQAAALQMVDAGKWLHFQHFRVLESSFAVLVVAGAQAVLVTAGLLRFRTPFGWLRQNLHAWQILAVTGFAFLSSAAPSENVSSYLQELVLATTVYLVNAGNVILIIASAPQSVVDRIVRILRNLPRPQIAGAVWITILAGFLSFFVYQRHPHITDEVVYLYQARFLASGHITLPAPPVPEAFEVDLMESKSGVWYPAPPFGWPALLAAGVFIGLPWIVNPLLAGINVLLSYHLVRRLYDEHIARLCVALLCVSPWFAFMGMNFMTHQATMFLALSAALSLTLAIERKSYWAVIAGISTGYLSLIRPVDGLLIGSLLGLRALGVGIRRLSLFRIILFGVTTIVVGSTVFWYNKTLTGNPMLYPINEYNDTRYGHNANAYGFGPDRGMGWGIDPNRGHSPVDGLINAALNTSSIQTDLFGWSCGSILPLALFFFTGLPRKNDWYMIAVLVAVFGYYFFYYFSGGPDFGARYWFLMILPLIVLSIRGLERLQIKAEPEGLQIMTAAIFLSVTSLLIYIPWRAVDKYHHYLDMQPGIREMAKEKDFGRSLVLIRGEVFPDYASAAIYNPLDLNSDSTIYAWDKDTMTRQKVLRYYTDRPVWFIDGPSLTKNGYQIVIGPVQGKDLLSRIEAGAGVSTFRAEQARCLRPIMQAGSLRSIGSATVSGFRIERALFVFGYSGGRVDGSHSQIITRGLQDKCALLVLGH